MLSRPAEMPSITVVPEHLLLLGLVPPWPLLGELVRMELLSPKAECLHLLLEVAEREAEVDEWMMLVGTGDGGRMMAGLSFKSLLFSPSSSASTPCSCSFAFPFPFLLLDKAGMFEAAPRDCCEARKACLPLAAMGMISLMRLKYGNPLFLYVTTLGFV